MLKKTFKLKKSFEIRRLLESPSCLKNSLFVVKYESNNLLKHRFCVIINKKFKLKSVERNKIKRKIYEIIRNSLSVLPQDKTADFAIIIKNTDCIKAKFEIMQKSLNELLNKI